MARLRLLASLRRCPRGAAALEFALILPVLLLGIFGCFEVAIALFIGASIENAVMEASRFGVTNENETRAERVLEIVAAKTYGLVDMDAVILDTLVYQSFADIGRPEPFTDENDNARYDAGEPYTDVNGNGQWDVDMGAAGLGGPDDIVVYRVRYSSGVMTPLIREVLGESVQHMSSVAVRNEPF